MGDGLLTVYNKNKIILLDSSIADQIAAGEVVERPASVVKELIENALDAAAKQITIEVQAGGLNLIRVRDNGQGIGADDLTLAFARHATSKIHQSKDLTAIETLGFRGEALPSIAAVSWVEMDTRPAKVIAGQKIIIAGGEILETVETGCPPGTVVTVTDLFYNTPARRQYMKKPSTENRAVATVVERLALAHPEVAFDLRLDGRRSLSTPGDGNFHTVVAAIYGLEVGKELLPIKAAAEKWQLEGFVSPPWLHRARRKQQVLIVNGRYIYNHVLRQGIERCYQTVIPSDRYPIFIIHLCLQPQLVDVNVHPAKLEVRFQQEYELAQQITIPIKKALLTSRAVAPANIDLPSKHRQKLSPAQQRFYFDAQAAEKMQAWGEYILKERQLQSSDNRITYNRSKIPYPLETTEGTAEKQIHLNTVASKSPGQALPPLKAIGQIFKTYILAEGEDGLYIIDQHAAHELCRFAKLQKKVKETNQPGQMLEPPITLQLTPAATVKLMDQITALEDLGFVMEKFGTNTFLLRSVPVGVLPGTEKKILEDFLEDGLSLAKDRLLKLIACHGAIKAGDVLAEQEIQKLLDELQGTARPYTCPHGRPAVVRLDHSRLARYFHRTLP